MTGERSFQEALEVFDVRGFLEKSARCKPTSRTHVMVQPCPLCGDPRKDKFYCRVDGSDKNGIWNSYCCHDGGNLVSLIEKSEKISRREAVSQIWAEYDGEEMDRVIPITAPPTVNWQPATGACEVPRDLVTVHPDDGIVYKGKTVRLRDRGVDDWLIAQHGLRRVTAPPGCRVPLFKGESSAGYDHRLFIPIYHHENVGEIFSWQLRDLTGLAGRKYLFPPEDRSSKTLYGWRQAKLCPTVLLVEGVFNKWAWDLMGVRMDNPHFAYMATASFGKKLSDEQIELIIEATHVKRVVIAWDLDAAAQINKVAKKLSGRKEIYIMEASLDGRDLDDLSDQEKKELFVRSRPYSFELAAEMNTRAALLGH